MGEGDHVDEAMMEDVGGVTLLALEEGILSIDLVVDNREICVFSPGQKPMPTCRNNTISPMFTLSVVET